MQFLLDHLGSFIVFSAVMLIVAILQLRGMQSNAETVVNHIVRTGTLEISDMLERDLVNMRTEAQTNDAIAGGFADTSMVVYDCSMAINGDTTMSFTFPTLKFPQMNVGNPDTAQVAQVLYQLTPQAGSVTRYLEGDTLVQNFYRLDRFVSGEGNGWSDTGVTFFRVEYAEPRDPVFKFPAGNCPLAISKIRFQVQMAHQGFEEVTDQESRTQLNISRYGATVELTNWD